MQFLKRVGRVLIISFFIILASFGIGIFGINFRESVVEHENRIELVKKKDDDEDLNDVAQNEVKG
ncbi:MAG TPA: hypothetical protein VFZ52_04995 [Chryseolinea sp.]